MPIPFEIVDRYGWTWVDFVFGRPRRFYEIHRGTPDRHLKPVLFAAATVAVYSAVMAGAAGLVKSFFSSKDSPFSHSLASRLDTQALVTSSVVMIAVFLFLDLPIAKLAGLVVRRKTTVRNLLVAKCYALALILLFAATQTLTNLTYVLVATTGTEIDVNTAGLIEIGVGLLLACVAALYTLGAMAAFNGIRFRRFLVGYLTASLPIMFVGGYFGWRAGGSGAQPNPQVSEDSLTRRHIEGGLSLALPVAWVPLSDSPQAGINLILDTTRYSHGLDSLLQAGLKNGTPLVLLKERAQDRADPSVNLVAVPSPGLTPSAYDSIAPAELAADLAPLCNAMEEMIGRMGFRAVSCDPPQVDQGAGRTITVTRLVRSTRWAGILSSSPPSIVPTNRRAARPTHLACASELSSLLRTGTRSPKPSPHTISKEFGSTTGLTQKGICCLSLATLRPIRQASERVRH